jgi:Sortase domain
MAQNTPSRGGGIFEKAPLPVIGGIAAVAVIGIIIVGVALSSGGGNDNPTAVTGATGTKGPTATAASGGLQTAQPTAVATADLTQPTADAENLQSIDGRMVIPRFNIDAPLTYRAVGGDGVMPNPEGPDDIAYYDFSAWPGKGGRPGVGNPVFAGHVDSGHAACNHGTVPPPCTAVLWDLNNLSPNDEIHLIVGDTQYNYAVTSNEPVSAANGPWDQIVSSTADPTLTIITCGGDFNRATGEYDNRQVLKAKLVGTEPAS